MDLNHIALNEIPPQGATYRVADEAVWVRRLGEYGVSCRIVEPVEAEVLVLPQEDGCLLRGVIRGVVAMPCNRCMDETLVVLNQSKAWMCPFGNCVQRLQLRFPAALQGTERIPY